MTTSLARYPVYQRLAVHRDRLRLVHMRRLSADDPRRYRQESDVEGWWKKDPIPRFRAYLDGLAAHPIQL